MLTSSNADPAFTKNGFSNWKNAKGKKKGFQKHESSDSHVEAVARHVTAPATVIGDIGDLLSERHALAKSKYRKILLSILLWRFVYNHNLILVPKADLHASASERSERVSF